MANWYEYAQRDAPIPEWPYPIRYEKEQEIATDVLVLGGGIAGCWTAISAARQGVRVVLVEKGATVRSGQGGPGCDNWCDVPAHPLISVDPDEWARRRAGENGGYNCGIGRQIQSRESFDTLLEMEKMGGKIRDTEDMYVGAEGRDEKTKFIVQRGRSPLQEVLVWGTTFKPALKKECQRLGVKIYDRVMASNLLTEDGIQGTKVIGATGFNSRTGEFMVFKANATVLCMAGPGWIWVFLSELNGLNSSNKPRALTGDGIAMAWRAGAALTMMEQSSTMSIGTGYKHKWYTGASDASYTGVPMVDANGKALPPVTGGRWDVVREGVLKGEYALPFYGDFPAMSEIERKVTWGMRVGEESTTKDIVKTFTKAGFDPAKDMMQSYQLIEGRDIPQWRSIDYGRRGGLVIDWDLKTSLEGLYATGQEIYSPGDHSFAAATGRYAGRKAAAYARGIGEPVISKEQIMKEKARIYAPIKRNDGIEWKELHVGIARTMQYYCTEYKTELLLNTGLEWLKDIEENWVPRLFAVDPHKLLRSMEDLSVLSVAQSILHASLARKASSRFLDFHRIDYPELDTPGWHKLVTVRQENGNVKVGELPLDYAGSLKENYEANNKDYTGVCNG
jgi:succinate dehydrogenase/fumarate reductase flavoprotein subunit